MHGGGYWRGCPVSTLILAVKGRDSSWERRQSWRRGEKTQPTIRDRNRKCFLSSGWGCTSSSGFAQVLGSLGIRICRHLVVRDLTVVFFHVHVWHIWNLNCFCSEQRSVIVQSQCAPGCCMGLGQPRSHRGVGEIPDLEQGTGGATVGGRLCCASRRRLGLGSTVGQLMQSRRLDTSDANAVCWGGGQLPREPRPFVSGGGGGRGGAAALGKALRGGWEGGVLGR